MWQTTTSKERVTVNQKTVEKKVLKLRIQRITVELKQPEVNEPFGFAHVLLNDFLPESIVISSSTKLGEGQELILKFPDHEKIEIKVKTNWLMETYSQSHIVSNSAYRYRIGLDYQFENDEQKKQVLEFSQKLRQTYLTAKTLSKAA